MKNFHLPDAIIQPKIWAIVPVKPLHESKTRLAHLLSPAQRAELMHGFLQRTLGVLKLVTLIDGILVVSSDPVVLATTRQFGVVALDEGSVRGLNHAVTRAVKLATHLKASAALIIPADLPFLQRTHVELMIPEWSDLNGDGRQGSSAMAICGDDNRDGTNALFISLPIDFKFHYGVNSFEWHLQEATRLGITPRIVYASGLAFDLDTEDDWSKYQQETRNQPPALYTSQSMICM